MSGSGLFLGFEGLDGAGKSTAAERVTAQLRHRGLAVDLLPKRGPWTPWVPGYCGEHLDALAGLIWDRAMGSPTHDMGDAHWVRLVAAYFAGVAHTAVAPRLAAGRVVVVDNWYGKFVAKVHVDGGWPLADFKTVFGDVPAPDLTVFLDVPPVVAEARKHQFTHSETGGRVRHDRRPTTPDTFVSYQSRVARCYHELIAWGGWAPIDASVHDAGAVADRVVALLQDRVDVPTAPVGARP